jgi:hypothetical protein
MVEEFKLKIIEAIAAITLVFVEFIADSASPEASQCYEGDQLFLQLLLRLKLRDSN